MASSVNLNSSPEPNMQRVVFKINPHRVVIHRDPETMKILSLISKRQYHGLTPVVVFFMVNNENVLLGRGHRSWVLEQLSVHVYPMVISKVRFRNTTDSIVNLLTEAYERFYASLPEDLKEELPEFFKDLENFASRPEGRSLLPSVLLVRCNGKDFTVDHVDLKITRPVRLFKKIDEVFFNFVISSVVGGEFNVKNPAIYTAQSHFVIPPLILSKNDKLQLITAKKSIVEDSLGGKISVSVNQSGNGNVFAYHEVPYDKRPIKSILMYPYGDGAGPIVLFSSGYQIQEIEIEEQDDRVVLRILQRGSRYSDEPVGLEICYAVKEPIRVRELAKYNVVRDEADNQNQAVEASLSSHNPFWVEDLRVTDMRASPPIVQLRYPDEQALYVLGKAVHSLLFNLSD
ncbi:MAG: hypothetical protein N2654_05940 [Deltaproteobacteria bacterium]|nr:hypothetical protein [Deltaproteobacteria bacterium]